MIASPPDQLARELDDLRRAVASLQATLDARLHLTLRSDRPQLFLGQPARLEVRVVDGQGQARVNVPVTLVASWGRLRTTEAYPPSEGTALTMRTGVDGRASVVLTAPTDEPLWDVQQDALSTALASLDAKAETPRQVEDRLRALVAEYRWEAALHFRRAVDILFRDFGQALLEALNSQDYLAAWSYFDTVVMAHAGSEEAEGDDAPVVQASAVQTLRFKNWLGPWLQTYLASAQADSPLREDLRASAAWSTEAGSMLNQIYASVQAFMGRDAGVAGEYINRKVASTDIRSYLMSDMQDLPLDSRIAVFSSLNVAARVVATSSPSVLAAATQTRRDLRREIGKTVEIGKIPGLADRLQGLDERVADLPNRAEVLAGLQAKADAQALEAVRTAVAGKADSQALDQLRGSLTEQLKGKLDSGAFTEFQARLGQRLDAKADAGLVDQIRQSVANKLDSSALAEFSDRFNERWRRDLGNLDDRIKRIERRG